VLAGRRARIMGNTPSTIIGLMRGHAKLLTAIGDAELRKDGVRIIDGPTYPRMKVLRFPASTPAPFKEPADLVADPSDPLQVGTDHGANAFC